MGIRKKPIRVSAPGSFAIVPLEMPAAAAAAFQGSDHPEDVKVVQDGWREKVASMRVDTPLAVEPIGLFWQTADGVWHFSPGSVKRGDIHDNGRPIRVAYLGEEAK